MVERLLHDGLSARARSAGGAPAVIDGERIVTYGELDCASDNIAAALLDLGVGPGDRVGIWAPKSALVLAAMQAALRLGAAYVPLDPLAPRARVRAVAADCGLRAVVGVSSLSAEGDAPRLELDALEGARVFERRAPPPARPPTRPEDLAYILYTSGTTGAPKGVCVSHRAALAFVDWGIEAVGLRASDRLANHAPLHFDLSVFDVHAALHAGASVALVPEGSSLLGAALVDFVARHAISIWYSVPSALVMMTRQGGLLDLDPVPLRAILFAGEVFPIDELRRLRDGLPGCRLLNLYGPTETNVCTFFEVTKIPEGRATPVPIGAACCGDRAHARRDDGGIAAPGELGELWIEGPTLMTGYWGRPPLDAAYGTGDVVRVLDDGTFEFVGRRDHQVKIRGHRVELGEIEAALVKHPAVREACVVVTGEGITARLLGFLVCSPDRAAPTLLEIKKHCRTLLARPLIVDAIRRLDALPRTRNAKIDRRALAASLERTEPKDP